MVARRRAVCLVLAPLGGLGLIWASGVIFWLALGVVMVGLAGVLLPVQSPRARFAPTTMVVGSVIVGLVLLETALWLWEKGCIQASLLPEKLMRVLAKRTRVGQLLDERSAALVRMLGLKPDFYADLLVDFDARYERFGDDVAAMNEFVTGSGLPPMVAMVLDQYPRLNGPGRQLAIAAERQLRAAGIETVSSEDIYRRYDGRSFRVSRWEGHPNEEAHAIWASELAATIR
jgi:hypothetical protein